MPRRPNLEQQLQHRRLLERLKQGRHIAPAEVQRAMQANPHWAASIATAMRSTARKYLRKEHPGQNLPDRPEAYTPLDWAHEMYFRYVMSVPERAA